MNIPEKIEQHLNDLEAIIRREARNPEQVLESRLLRSVFAIAFPPDGLAPKLAFQGEADDLSRIAAAHRPYYSGKQCRSQKSNPQTGVTQRRSSLNLKAVESVGCRLALIEDGHLRESQPGLTRDSGKPDTKVMAKLRVRRELLNKLGECESLKMQADRIGDSQLSKLYQSQIEAHRDMLDELTM